MAQLPNYPGKVAFKFYDGEILAQYRECGEIQSHNGDTLESRYGAVAPLVPSEQVIPH